MRLSHRGDDRRNEPFGNDDFEPPFVHVLAPTLLPDGWVVGIGAEERPLPRESEAALAVLADDAGPGREKGVRHFTEIGIRDENDELTLASRVAGPQWDRVDDAEPSAEDVVDPAGAVVERGVGGVNCRA